MKAIIKEWWYSIVRPQKYFVLLTLWILGLIIKLAIDNPFIEIITIPISIGCGVMISLVYHGIFDA